ncbi:MAG: ribonuclease J [Bacilli bacterium]|nr:ribonuclease J [Bacilli bacterium]MBR6113369.1 ribonuclease J [Bacilli bacterium]
MKFFENNTDTKVFALGGLGEVGKNMYCIMHGNELVIVDSGVLFPEADLLGIDYVIPDFSFLKENENKIKGLFITHGHEDHIGSIPFLLQTVNIPAIYAPNQAANLIKKKLADRNIRFDNIIVYNEKDKYKFKNIEVEFIATTHSIPDSYAIVIRTPDGVIVESGDYKFDMTPIGPMANLQKMAKIGSEGVTLLMNESTNVEREGVSLSESKVDEALSDLFRRQTGRIIVATFASNVFRLKHIIETAKRNNRKVVLFGRSMVNQVEIAIESGIIENNGTIISPEESNNLKPEEVCLLCTGTQGEPLAALSRMANGTHKQIKLVPSDIVIFSSSPIPGNGEAVAITLNKLALNGIKTYTNAILGDIHSSGHGNQEELKLMIRLLKPKYLMPIHGDYRYLRKHEEIAIACKMPKNHIFPMMNGEILSIKNGVCKRAGSFPCYDIYVDGNRIGDVGGAVIKDRKIMSNDGILVLVCNLDIKGKKLLGKVNQATRGFVLVNENEELLSQIENKAEEVIKRELNNKKFNIADLKNKIITDVNDFIIEKTGRKPIIMPVIMDIKSSDK